MRGANYLPSKYFLTVALPLFSAAIIGALFLLYNRNNEAPESPTELLAASDLSSVRTRAVETDSDSDGLRDWEEILWNTDPNNQDSDGDGTKDGQEISLGRNPTLANQNDSLVASFTATGTVSVFATGTMSLTDRVGRELMGSYLVARQTGSELSTADQKRLVDEALARSVIADAPPRISTSSIVHVSATPEAARTYAEQVVAILMKTVVRNKVNELALVGKYLQEKDIVAKAELDVQLHRIREAADQLQKIAVPEDAVTLHVELINACIAYAMTMEALGNVEHDPMRAAVATSRYDIDQPALQRSVTAFHTYRKAKGVLLSTEAQSST